MFNPTLDDDDYDSVMGNYVRRNTLDDEYGCDLPGECLMAGPHMRSECHTANMLEKYEADAIRVEE